MFSFLKKNSEYLNKPILTVDVNAVNPGDYYRVLPVDDGGVLVSSGGSCIKLDHTGATMRTLLTSLVTTGLMMLNQEDLIILQTDGTITKVKLSDGTMVHTYKVDVGDLWDGVIHDDNTLILLDRDRGEVFTYCMSDQHKDIKIKKLNYPTCVTKTETNQGTLYLVCEAGNNNVHIYSSSWTLQRSIGSFGSGDGQFSIPCYVQVLPTNNILVADCYNYRISEYNMNGQFIRHVLQQQDGIYRPVQISYHHPNVWAIYWEEKNIYHLKCFQMFKS